MQGEAPQEHLCQLSILFTYLHAMGLTQQVHRRPASHSLTLNLGA